MRVKGTFAFTGSMLVAWVVKPIHMITPTKYYHIEAVYDLLGDTVTTCDYEIRAVNDDCRSALKE